jgi:hypothetical protein
MINDGQILHGKLYQVTYKDRWREYTINDY